MKTVSDKPDSHPHPHVVYVPGCGELLAFLPVPDDDGVVVVEADRRESLAVAGEVAGADAALVLALQDRRRLQRLRVPHVDRRVAAHLTADRSQSVCDMSAASMISHLNVHGIHAFYRQKQVESL